MALQSRITQGRKFDQVRTGAAEIFLRDGFSGASVDDIARSARVSKATLYSYFPDKRLMFREVLRSTLDNAFQQLPFDPDQAGPAPEALAQVVADMSQWLLTEPRLHLHRVIIAEAARFPEDALTYDRTLNERIVAPLAQLIDSWIAGGEIRAHDTTMSARQLVGLLIGQLQHRALLDTTDPTLEEIQQTAGATASLFLAAYR
ncbi:TetR/AcrR family transcriptional regulator [Paracoccus liaowanqingii]|uniref:TetR/AcrR family transcriptional regulator n=1 Tax=Paracoccus liaowanqingii TaxID=2560053 RepID=A0A4P7HHT6_9RHOB|nr:TetR/AcrR family transcriptional regulator [Paracoccus liaowanqingii]QBX33598.1 TetR/AcrR family transcriptional regulator [Paracoccus liaowanqingii]